MSPDFLPGLEELLEPMLISVSRVDLTNDSSNLIYSARAAASSSKPGGVTIKYLLGTKHLNHDPR